LYRLDINDTTAKEFKMGNFAGGVSYLVERTKDNKAGHEKEYNDDTEKDTHDISTSPPARTTA